MNCMCVNYTDLADHEPENCERFKCFLAPVEGDGEAETEQGELCESGMHSLRRSLQQ